MRRLLLALPFLAVALPVAAQSADIPPEADKLLVCSTVFSLKAQDDRDVGDEGGYTEWSMRSEELNHRAGLVLTDAGFNVEGIENVKMNYALTVGFEVGMGGARFSFEDCLVFVE